MNRFLIPVTATALAAGVAIPGFFGRRTIERVVTEPIETVAREVYHETPVVYTDTVYMAAEDPAPTQPVYVEEHNDYEYNQYNEYNHADVYVHEDVVVPPPRPHRREREWSPRDQERRPADRRRDDGSRGDRRRPGGSDEPGKPGPRPVLKVEVPAGNARQIAPVPPAPLPRPTPPQRKAPAKNASVQVTKADNGVPKHVPAPSVDKPVTPTSDEVQISLAKPARK